MKSFLTIILCFLITSVSFSQRNVDSLIDKAIEIKETNYFKLQEHFRRVRFTKEQLNLLLDKSIKHNYNLGKFLLRMFKDALIET